MRALMRQSTRSAVIGGGLLFEATPSITKNTMRIKVSERKRRGNI
jgi:hypothetical protein